MFNKKIIFGAVIFALIILAGAIIFVGRNSLYSSISTKPTGETGGVVIGRDDAPVIIEEYTNFLCSHCADFARDTLPRLMEAYVNTGKARILFYVSAPVELQKAAFCAAQESKFIEFHDYVFLHQTEITNESAVFDAAKNAGLDVNNFTQCYNSSAAKTAADDWSSKFGEAGVTGTPTFFINGEKLEGALPYSEFEKIMESKLK